MAESSSRPREHLSRFETEYPAPTLGVPIENRKIGGLGIMMVRKRMHDVRYRRAAGTNVLTIEYRS